MFSMFGRQGRQEWNKSNDFVWRAGIIDCQCPMFPGDQYEVSWVFPVRDQCAVLNKMSMTTVRVG